MNSLLVSIHGILTNQTDASWPDKLDAWMYQNAPDIKVLKKEYRAGPFPRWNCYIKDPRLAHSLANEIELFLDGKDAVTASPIKSTRHSPSRNCAPSPDYSPFAIPHQPAIWFVAHSNGAVIALLTAKILVQRGYTIAGLILTGAACEADIAKNGILEMFGRNALGSVIAYSSPDDAVLPGHRKSDIRSLSAVLYSALAMPYGSLGRTGLLLDGRPLNALDTLEFRPRILCNRFFGGGHSTYFSRWNIRRTFRQILADIRSVQRYHSTSNPCSPSTDLFS